MRFEDFDEAIALIGTVDFRLVMVESPGEQNS